MSSHEVSSAKLDPQPYATDDATDVDVRQNSVIAAEQNGRIARAEIMTSPNLKFGLPEV